MTRVVICAKSAWHPAIRREHEIARLAAEAGHDVVFVERPRDVRALSRSGYRPWTAELRRPSVRAEGLVTVARRSTVVPAHRSRPAGLVDGILLAPALRKLAGAVIVATVPWEWPAVARCTWARRVFDCADDWSQILPAHRNRILSLNKQIADEADVVVCASAQLAKLFEPRRVSVVPNGTPAALLATRPAPPPRISAMVYAGTMSERFDVPFVEALLDELPDWRLDLYGPCQYAGRGREPDAELAGLLTRWPERVAWHGSVERDDLAGTLDAGDVLVMPHRRRGAVGGDTMKFYDYAARGRPFATTPWSDAIEALVPPHTNIAATPPAFAAAVRQAGDEPEGFVATRRSWAEANAWEARWPAWAQAALG